MTNRYRVRFAKGVAAVLSAGLLAAACGSDKPGTPDSTNKPTSGTVGEKPTDKKPQPGGEISYGLEADTAGGYCLPEAQLAIAGIQVARAVYDTLMIPNADGEITPNLAKSMTANADNTEWTIELREGIVFHDGTKLDAEIVRDNLLAYAGLYAARSPLLFKFVFGEYTKGVETTGPLTVKVTLNKAWPAYPWFLYGSGRIGILGRAQLDDAATCNKNAIGTGPFALKEAVPNQRVVVEKNASYWQKDADGVQLPYLDKITFVPQEIEADRLTALKADDLQIMHTSSSNNIDDLRTLSKDGTLASIESNKFGEVSYLLLNGTKPPFDNIKARQAVAYAQDRQLGNERLSRGIAALAQGPYAPGTPGFLEDAGYPEYDLAKAKSLVAEYKAETGNDIEFTYTFSSDPEGVRTAEFLQTLMKEAGITVNLNPVGDQSTLINLAIGRGQQAIGWRNHPGGDPDTNYVWWHCDAKEGPCDNLVNFGGWNDPEINALLEQGRASADQAERKTIYENLNREFAKKLWNLWSNYTNWSIASSPKVHGILGPPLPDGSKPSDGLATGHSLLGLWIEQ